MGKRNEYTDGTFNWVDLSTADTSAAKKFYEGIFGWKFEDIPSGEGMVYSKAFKGTDQVAALYDMGTEKKNQNWPSAWQSYINVEDLDKAIKKTTEANGKVVLPATDVMKAGRMAAIQDPTGGFVCLWEAQEHVGATRVNEVSTFCWNELGTRDIKTAKDFYSYVFGWTFKDQTEPMPYTEIENKGQPNGGMMDISNVVPADVPPHWLVYFTVENTDQTLDKAKSLGATVVMEPMDITVGRFAVVADPQGAAFAVIALNTVEQ